MNITAKEAKLAELKTELLKAKEVLESDDFKEKEYAWSIQKVRKRALKFIFLRR